MAVSHLKLKEKCLRNSHNGKAIPSQFWLADLSRNHVRAEVSGTCAELNLRHLTELANVGSLLLKIFSSYRSCWNNWNRFEKEKALKTLIAWKEFKKEVFEVNNPFVKAPQWRLKFWWVFLFNLLFDGAFFCWLLCNSSVLCLLFATVNNSGVMLVNPFLVFPFFLEIFANVTEMATSFPQNAKGCNFGEAASCLAKFCQIVHWLQMTKSVTTQIMA